MLKVLFVDDDSAILEGLRRTLHRQRREWDMDFVTSGREALERLEREAVDVLVSDMRMPEMDGAELLMRAQQQSPETVRFVLSGYSELEAVMRTVPVAHQFLTKPCDPEVLRRAVGRACEIRELMKSEPLRALVGEIRSLPTLPATYHQLVRMMADPEVDLDRVVQLVEKDIGVSTKLLQLGNSAFFGLPRKIESVSEAIHYLGLNTIRDLVLGIEVFQPPEGLCRSLLAFLSHLQRRSSWVASLARSLCENWAGRERAFLGGMLHDVGLLVLATELSERFSETLREARESGRTLARVEEETYGATHMEVGAYLLGVWGLPYPVLEAAAFHHEPARLQHPCFDETVAVHVAGALVEEVLPLLGEGSPNNWPLDRELLEQLHLSDQLDEWRARRDELQPSGCEEKE